MLFRQLYFILAICFPFSQPQNAILFSKGLQKIKTYLKKLKRNASNSKASFENIAKYQTIKLILHY
jgi:hypothetical protein